MALTTIDLRNSPYFPSHEDLGYTTSSIGRIPGPERTPDFPSRTKFNGEWGTVQ